MYANFFSTFSQSHWNWLFTVALVGVWPGSHQSTKTTRHGRARGRASGSNRITTPQATERTTNGVIHPIESESIESSSVRLVRLVVVYRYRNAWKHRRAVRHECISIFMLCRKQTVLDSKFFETVQIKRPKRLVESAINIGFFFHFTVTNKETNN